MKLLYFLKKAEAPFLSWTARFQAPFRRRTIEE